MVHLFSKERIILSSQILTQYFQQRQPQTHTISEIMGPNTILRNRAFRYIVLFLAIAYSIFLLLARFAVLNVLLSSWMIAIGFFLWAVVICIEGKDMTWGKTAVVFVLSLIAFLATTMI